MSRMYSVCKVVALCVVRCFKDLSVRAVQCDKQMLINLLEFRTTERTPGSVSNWLSRKSRSSISGHSWVSSVKAPLLSCSPRNPIKRKRGQCCASAIKPASVKFWQNPNSICCSAAVVRITETISASSQIVRKKDKVASCGRCTSSNSELVNIFTFWIRRSWMFGLYASAELKLELSVMFEQTKEFKFRQFMAIWSTAPPLEHQICWIFDRNEGIWTLPEMLRLYPRLKTRLFS